MSTTRTIRCNHCHKIKGEVNHWWKISVAPKQLGFMIWQSDRILDYPADNLLDVCGEACAQAKLSEFLQGKFQ